MSNMDRTWIDVAALRAAFGNIKDKDKFEKEINCSVETIEKQALTNRKSTHEGGIFKAIPVVDIFRYFRADVCIDALVNSHINPSAYMWKQTRSSLVISFYSTLLELFHENEMKFDYIGMTIIQALDTPGFDLNGILIKKYRELVKHYVEKLRIADLATYEASALLLDSDLIRLCFDSRSSWEKWKEDKHFQAEWKDEEEMN